MGRTYVLCAPHGDKYAAYDFCEVDSRLLDLEKEGRELATRLQLEAPSSRLLEKAARWADIVENEVSWVGHSFESILDELCMSPKGEVFGGKAKCESVAEAEAAVQYLEAAASEIISWANELMMGGEASGRYAYAAKSQLLSASELIKRAGGRACAWLAGLDDIEYRLSAAVNDLSACIHALEELLMKWDVKNVKTEGWCSILDDATPEAKKACREWSRLAQKLADADYYSSEDKDMLYGYASDNRVQLRVGSAGAHLAEIDLNTGKLAYYDRDEEVNRVMAWLLEDYAGLECEVKVDRELGMPLGVECTEAKGEKAARAARVLALATSMDIRMKFAEKGELWPDATGALAKIREEYRRIVEEGGEPERVEYKRGMLILSNV